ncbi:hypothetical protein [Pseudomonas sp. Marseille-Q5299]|uniref:hypothetical protein n=1 Tax=Pseudomonas sp. Marseille-Q5299 TaxID=2942201 RepID=UPI002072D9E8|nr:hypothetical protein [Pseudomonas sp. Marseille-Q5299]
MSQATQVFNGVLFVTHPSTPKAFIRVDVLQKQFAERVTECRLKAMETSAYPPEIKLICLRLLLDQVRPLQFPHAEMFKREAERQGVPLDNQAYLVVEAAATRQLKAHYLDISFYWG